MPSALAAGSSLPFFANKQPQQVLEAGVRLDGRGYEEFRAVCEWQIASPASSTDVCGNLTSAF